MKRLIGTFSLALLTLLPGSITYAAGDASLQVGAFQSVKNSSYITTDITLDSPSQAVSAVGVHLTVKNLRLISGVTDSSVFSQEVQVASSSGDTVTLARSRSDEGFTGTAAQVERLVWQPLSTGPASVSIDLATSQVLAYADASNILGKVGSTTGNVTAPKLTAASTPKTEAGIRGKWKSFSASVNKALPMKTVLAWFAAIVLLIGLVLLVLGALNLVVLRKKGSSNKEIA